MKTQEDHVVEWAPRKDVVEMFSQSVTDEDAFNQGFSRVATKGEFKLAVINEWVFDNARALNLRAMKFAEQFKVSYITADQEHVHRMRPGFKPIEGYANLVPLPGEVGFVRVEGFSVVERVIVVTEG